MFSQIMNSFIASREKGGTQSGGISNERVLASNSDSRLRKSGNDGIIEESGKKASFEYSRSPR